MYTSSPTDSPSNTDRTIPHIALASSRTADALRCTLHVLHARAISVAPTHTGCPITGFESSSVPDQTPCPHTAPPPDVNLTTTPTTLKGLAVRIAVLILILRVRLVRVLILIRILRRLVIVVRLDRRLVAVGDHRDTPRLGDCLGGRVLHNGRLR